jgi:hypothetical protein
MRPWTILGAAVLALVPLACRDEPDTTLYPERIEPAPQVTSKTSAEERAATPEASMRPGATRDSRDSGVAAAHFPRNCQSVFRVDVPALMKVPGARDELLPTFLGTTARDEKKPTAQDPARDTPDERDAKAADETKARDENKAANEHEGATTSKKTSDDMKAADDVKAQKTAEEKAPAKTAQKGAPTGAQKGKGAETAAPFDLPAILADAGLDPEKDVKEVAFCTLATADGPHVEQPSLPPGQQGQHGGSPTPKTQLDQPTKELPAAKDAQRSTTPPPTGEPIPSSSARAKTDKPSTKAAKETEVVIIVVPTTASGAAMKLIEARKLDKRDVAGAVAAQDAERHYYVGESGDGAIILAKSEMALRDALHVTEPASCPLGHDTAMSLCMMDDPLGAAMGSSSRRPVASSCGSSAPGATRRRRSSQGPSRPCSRPARTRRRRRPCAHR